MALTSSTYARLMGLCWGDCDSGLALFSERLVAATAGRTAHGVTVMFEDFLKLLETHILIQRSNTLEEFVELGHNAPPDASIISGVIYDVKPLEE